MNYKTDSGTFDCHAEFINVTGTDDKPILFYNDSITIEDWDNHNPCYHRPCDDLDIFNFDYAVEMIRLNLAMTALKAGAVLESN